MEDMEIFHHIDQWTPGSSVLPSIPNEEQIGSVQKFSGTTIKQKLQADQCTGTFSELGLDKQKKSLQTKVLPGDVGGNLNSTVLPPELLNDILSLREDYPEEGCIVNLGRKADLIHGQRKQNKGSHQSETHQKTFSEDIAKFKTFESAVDNVFEGVVFHDDNSKDFSVRKEKSCQGSDKIPLEEGSNDVSVLELSRKSSIAKGCAFNDKGNASFPEGSASFPEGSASPGKVSIGELQSPAKRAVNKILEKHFASKGKILCPLDLQGTSGYTGITNTISVSELRQAAQYHGCTNDILFFSNHDPPNTNGPHTQSNSSGIGETFEQWKLAEPDGLGNLAKQGHRPTYLSTAKITIRYPKPV
ncbi:uncharacterized protein LOC123553899 isoform X2 [Mercenaria mercenaria]|uniref:uncharacterized protein LOC123553899 isoform X2 n=1 Tax=Mercenaria mercenaria TaxID=6596 RepID=UPI00234F8D0E|nr:uncharacterized protein LOC123553899 isoform X2 [Mercenaria mercenaria]